jgi:hypothetical protein
LALPEIAGYGGSFYQQMDRSEWILRDSLSGAVIFDWTKQRKFRLNLLWRDAIGRRIIRSEFVVV